MLICVGLGRLVSKICLYYADAKGVINNVAKLKRNTKLHIQFESIYYFCLLSLIYI